MATLEIHDGRNQVRRVRITRDNPAMFGSDPMCDIVLEGQGVQPFHGRIRWKTRRFKADASPEVPWIEVNGVQVKSKSIYQGDEIRVGACRIFLLSLEEGPDHGEKTVIQDAPTTRPGQRSPAATDFARMEMAPPSIEAPEPHSSRGGTPQVPLKRSRHAAAHEFEDVDEVLSEPKDKKRKKSRTLSGLMRKVGEKSAELPPQEVPMRAKAGQGYFGGMIRSFERAPGDDRVLGSPLVIGLVVTFTLLVGLSIGLWNMIARANAGRQYTVATEDMEAGNFPNAIKGFDAFLVSNPADRRAGKAKVFRALARVRQHTGNVGASWGNAVKEAVSMVEEVGQLEEYRDSSLELADDLRKAAEALADRAADLAEPKILAEADSAVRLHARVAGQATASLIERSKIPEKLAKARAAIQKSRDRGEAIASMDAALKAKNPGDAYSTRDALVRRYGDLAVDKEISQHVILANEQVQQAVSFDPAGRPGETSPREEAAGPPTSLVLRIEPGKPPSTGNSPVAFALADGLAFGIDALNGAPRWQVPVGPSSPFPPLAIAGDPPSVLVVDARSNELTRRNARTGALLWRQGLEGLVADPPLILGNQLFQPTLDGRLLQLDLATGSLRATLRLGRGLARTPVADDTVSHLYLLADEDCLFVLALDPLQCVAVEYLGHDAGSVAAPPARAGRYYVLPENHAIDQGRWRVFVIDESGVKLKQVQELPVGGWTDATPATSGPVIWSSSDRGELIAYSIGLYDAKSPFTPIVRIAPNSEVEGPAFPRAKTERDFWLASSRSGRFELDLERGRLANTWTRHEAGPALAPPQAFDRTLVLTQQDEEGPGTALWGLDPNTGDVRWRTTLGASWTVPLTNSTSGDRLSTLGIDGRDVAIGLDRLRDGGFVELPLPRPGVFRVPASTTQRLEIDGATVVVPEPAASRIFVRVGSGEFRPVELPAPLASPILALGKDLVIPGLDGRIYLVDPRTGASAADPYVPPFDRSRPIRWRTPVPVEGGAFVLADSEATLRRLAVDHSGRPRLAVTSELKLDKALVTDPTSTGASILVVTVDGKVRSLASRDLGPQGSWPLEAPRLLGPIVVAEHAFVADAAGNVLAFAPDGRRIWSVRMRDTVAAGPPAVLDRSAWFLGRDGSIQRFSIDDGTPQSWALLDILPSGGPLAVGPELAMPTGRGSVRLLDTRAKENTGASKQ
jgi:outer membrane protein assembly factor BamB